MAANTSDYLRQAVINWARGTTMPAAPAGLYVGLGYGAVPDHATAGTECAATGSYARTAVTLSAPTAGATSNSGVVTFPTATADWASGANLTWFGIFDAATSGNRLFVAPLTTAKPVLNGDTPDYGAGALTIALT